MEKEEDLEVEKKDLKGVVEDLLGRLKHWAGEAEVLEGEVKGSVVGVGDLMCWMEHWVEGVEDLVED